MKWRLDPGQIEVLDDAMVQLLQRKTPAQRVAMIGAAHRTAQLMIHASIRRRHPDWDEQAIRRETARRLSGGTG